MLSPFPTLSQSLPSQGGLWQGAVRFQSFGWVLSISMVMTPSREVASVLGRSQQQGKNENDRKTQSSAVVTVGGGGSQAAGPGHLHLGRGGRMRGLGILQLWGYGWRLAQEVVSGYRGGCRWGRVRRRGGGQAPGPARHSVDSRDESRMSS